MFFGKKKNKEVKMKDIEAMAKRIEVMNKDMDVLTNEFLKTIETNIQNGDENSRYRMLAKTTI